MQPKVNRRDFLKIAGITSAAALIACRASGSENRMVEDMEPIRLEGQNGKRYLVAYSSKYGSTAGIARAIGEAWHSTGASVDVLPVSDVDSFSGYDGALIGSPIYAGAWRQDALSLVETHQAALQEMPVAYFAGCLMMASDDPQEIATAQTYCDAPAEIVTPASAPGIFAAKVDRAQLNLVDKLILTVMRANYGDHRRWDEIQAWALATISSL